MHVDLAQRWLGRRHLSPFLQAASFAETGLFLGHGTVLLRIAPRPDISLDTDAAHDRLVALLAFDLWRRGDRAIAAIRLAFAPLPRLASEADAYRLFLAETALSAGLRPRELLAELGYAKAESLLKGIADQPRVPAGSGRTSGQWTSGSTATDASNVIEGRSAAVEQHADHGTSTDSGRSIIPVFLRPERHGDDAVTDKPSPYRSEPPDEAIDHGHALDLLVPKGAPLPFALPVPSPQADEDDKDGPACPRMEDDVGHGASAAAQRFEALIARLVNPSDPTPKQSPETPDVKSQAYFLPQPNMVTGKVSYDDCKRTIDPSPIVGIRKGDMVEMKSEGASFTYYYDSLSGSF